jgi:hypothetical protein
MKAVQVNSEQNTQRSHKSQIRSIYEDDNYDENNDNVDNKPTSREERIHC